MIKSLPGDQLYSWHGQGRFDVVSVCGDYVRIRPVSGSPSEANTIRLVAPHQRRYFTLDVVGGWTSHWSRIQQMWTHGDSAVQLVSTKARVPLLHDPRRDEDFYLDGVSRNTWEDG